MGPLDLAAIRPHIEKAVRDIDYYLTTLDEWGKFQREMSEMYDLMAAGETPPEVKGLGKPVQLTKTQYMALIYGTKVRRRKRPDEPLDERQGTPLTDEEREAILAELDRSEPLSDAQREALAYWARGGWQDSSRRAAAWLRNAGENVAATGIDMALNRLTDEPRDATELGDYREAMRTEAEYVKTILEECQIQKLAHPGEAHVPDTKPIGGTTTEGKNRTTVEEETPASNSDLVSFTTDEIATLAGVSIKTLHNKLSESRSASDPSKLPPDPVVKGHGQRPDAYSYDAIRPWALITWPWRELYFPADAAVARTILLRGAS